MTAARLVLLSTTHRVPAGLLSRTAWQTLDGADAVLAPAGHPLVHLLDRDTEPFDAAALRPVLERARRECVVVLLESADADAVGSALPAALLAVGDDPPVIEVLPGSWDSPGAHLLDLVAVMDRLRSPGGCPWDAAQTHETLLPYLLEETYETVEAIETGDEDALREELGDLLLQVVFHARLAEERAEQPWSIDDVAAGIAAKLVRRHPHVFGGTGSSTAEAATADEVEANWETLKRSEKGRTSAVDGVPLAQPALALAAALLRRAQRAGLALDIPALAAGTPAPEGYGDLLLAAVAAAQADGVDAEAALREAARGLAGRIRLAEGGDGYPRG